MGKNNRPNLLGVLLLQLGFTPPGVNSGFLSINNLADNAFQASDNSLLSEVKGTYIVKLRAGNDAKRFIAQTNNFVGKKYKYTYNSKSFQGFATQLSENEVKSLQKDSRVEYIEEDGIMQIAADQASPPSWGLTRVSERVLDLTKPFVYPDTAGEGVDIWIVDTGVQESHADFEGRAKLIKSFVTGEANADLNGHGTHVAGTVGSATYGVAKKAKIYGVKVLNGRGSGTISGVLAGIQYVAQNARPGKSVVNMSLGGGKSKVIDDAVNAAVEAGIAFIVAAGNNAGDACAGSPSGASSAFAVAASDKTDKQAYFSNFGNCVKVYAPGVDITSLWKGNDGAKNTISGTSMASPHVAGVAALYLASGKYSTVNALYGALVSNATPNVISNPTKGTPNKLIYSETA
ncbi:putative alkaline serine protease [Syncephalis fuscata]|nr:putative alkaline serine protease [Syncephalis fuscata]